MLLTIGAALILALGSGFLVGLLWDAISFLPARNVVFQLVQGTIQALLLLGAFFLIYQYVPRGENDRRASVTGAATATVLFLAAQPLFLFYVQRFANYNQIYGPLGIAILLLVWVWVVALIALFGGEVASHTRAMLLEGRSAEEVARRHAARSPA